MLFRPLVRSLVRPLVRSPMEHGNLRPTLSLDFTNGGVTDSRVTYSGGANGTRVNSAGLIVAATTPRFDYNPVTLAPLGLLVEEARTNLMLRSSEFSNAAWTVFGTGSVTADAAVSPDGTSNADLLTFTSAGAGLFQAATGAATTAYTGTVYMRAAAPVTVNLVLTTNLADPVIVACSVTTAWQRFTVNKTTSGGTTVIALQIQDSGAGGTNVFAWGGQVEAGAFATSYIPTVAAAVTRSADSAVMTGTNFSSWFNASQGTFYVEGDTVNATAAVSQAFMSATDAANTDRMLVFRAGGGTNMTSQVEVGGVQQAAMIGGTVANGALFKNAFAYKANDFAASLGGAAAVTDASGSVPTVDRLVIGDVVIGSRSANGHIRAIRYYPQRLPNATLQGMTA